MKCFNVLVTSTLLLGMAWIGSTVAEGAELSGDYHKAQAGRARSPEVVAVTGCPDRYSCSPLYGSYGMPYGSPGYWARYTMSGWTSR